MLIGIDMLGVQSPRVERESGRIGRRFASALLALDPSNRYVLYTHEGLPTDRVPSGRNALRVSLSGLAGGPGSGGPGLRRILDHDPDGLDWLVLLDPFEPAYGGTPPEAPLAGVKVASLVADLDPRRVEDRRLAPLRRHDLLLAFSDRTAAECRRRLPSAASKVRSLGPAGGVSPNAGDSPGSSDSIHPDRLGICGPFVFASLANGAARSDLGVLLGAYHRLPAEYRESHQLVISGVVEEPWAAIAHLHEHGCADGLVLVGEVDWATLRALHGRCAAFIAPGVEEGSTPSLVEAMSCGAPIVAARAGSNHEVLGDAALFADAADPGDFAGQVARLLSDDGLAGGLRRGALARAGRLSWEPAIGAFLAALRGVDPGPPRPRLRFDREHAREAPAPHVGSSSGEPSRVG